MYTPNEDTPSVNKLPVIDTNKSHKLASQFVRYFGVALVGYLFDFGSLIFLRQVLGLHYLLAATLGFIAGLIVTYILSGKYVFGNPKLKSRNTNFIAFTLIGIVGLALLNFLMWVMTGRFQVNYVVSKIVATIVVYMWNFFARRSLYHDS